MMICAQRTAEFGITAIYCLMGIAALCAHRRAEGWHALYRDDEGLNMDIPITMMLKGIHHFACEYRTFSNCAAAS